MKMQPVDKPENKEVALTCLTCTRRLSSRDAWADLDGEPFKAYYCFSCKHKLEYVFNSRPFGSVDVIRRVASHVGSHFFDESSMRFFRSRIACFDVWADRYFITSEQFVGSNGIPAPRRYTIREITAKGSIETVGQFQQFATLREAKVAVKALR